MCGIIGIFNLGGQPVSPVLLREMTDHLAHRGPDGEGYYIDSFIGLGHRRLAIIDLTRTGHQPMVSSNEQYSIVYNGEVYNFLEIKAELEKCGYAFYSKTDTEVILNAYIEWGEACVTRFNGMFAFAIWNKQKQSLFMARDRYGIKPFYYYLNHGVLIFASEYKAILAHPKVKRELNHEALLEYFTFQNLFSPTTFINDIKILPAGHWAEISLGNTTNKLICQQYWDFCFQEPEQKLAEEEYIEELDRLFHQAVKRQLVGDVEVGVYLSGGMDSSAVTAIASKEITDIKSFTCGFDLHSASGIELAFDEREKAELVSYLFKTEHYEMVLKAGDMEKIFPLLAKAIETPRIGQSYPNYYMAKLASKFVKVVLSGAGGDEIFAGYPWRYYRSGVGSRNFENYIDQYYQFWQRLVPNTTIHQLFQPIHNSIEHLSTRDIFKSVFKENFSDFNSYEECINRSLYFEAKTFLHGLLIVEDKLSMAHSLEIRVPFLDNDLVDFAMRLPVSLKLNNLQQIISLNENNAGNKKEEYFKRTKEGKGILRKVMSRYLPNEIVYADKQGFSAPDASWFKGESIEYIKCMLFNRSARIYDYLDYQVINQLIEQHLHGESNRRLLIWSLLSFEWYLRTYFK